MATSASNSTASPSPLSELRATIWATLVHGLHDTYHCTRVWEAWNVGTMSRDDFEAVDQSDTPNELMEAIMADLLTPANVGALVAAMSDFQLVPKAVQP